MNQKIKFPRSEESIFAGHLVSRIARSYAQGGASAQYELR